MKDTIVVVDFGSQYTQLIVRKVRQLRVYCELCRHDALQEDILRLNPCGIILSGGPASVYESGAPVLADYFLTLGIPILGICYGMQLLAMKLGGRVEKLPTHEYGAALVHIDHPEGIFANMPKEIPVWMSHGDQVRSLPDGFIALAHSKSCPIVAMANAQRRIYATQFHPEVSHTPQGLDILQRFVFDVCRCKGDWTEVAFIQTTVEQIRARVGKERVLCGLSGGVDSTVAAMLIGKAVGDQLVCVFVDHGLLREGEVQGVAQLFKDHPEYKITVVNARSRFLQKLEGIIDPEEKRKIIGAEFIRTFEEAAAREAGEKAIRYLAQGTLYPDVIESRAPERQSAAHIKTHHNVGGLPSDLKFELIEPLRYLFKDEVRAVGVELGLPAAMVYRQPFPGPGLAVRILGAVTEERLEILRKADAIVREEIDHAQLEREIWQYFAVLTPLQTVGVMGDGRTYENVVAVRAVTSTDGMTADWARLPYDVLARISSRIINQVRGVNRVVYDITSKPPGTIEWE